MNNVIEQVRKRARIIASGTLLTAASFAVPASAAYSTHTVLYTGCLTTGICFAGVSPAVPAGSSSCDMANADQVRWNATSSVGPEFSRIATAAFLAGKRITIDTAASCDGPVGAQYPMINQLHITP